MIDEKKLLEDIRKEGERYEKKYGEKAKSTKLVWAILNVVEAIVKSQKKQKWIPVEECLPEQDGYYLVSGYYKNGHWKKIVGTVQYKAETKSFKKNWNFIPEAWMELPEAYEVEKDAEAR